MVIGFLYIMSKKDYVTLILAVSVNLTKNSPANLLIFQQYTVLPIICCKISKLAEMYTPDTLTTLKYLLNSTTFKEKDIIKLFPSISNL